METLIPWTLFLGPYFAPLLLRIGVALVFFIHAYTLSHGSVHTKLQAACSLVLALMFTFGFLTQLAALAGVFYIIFLTFFNTGHTPFFSRSFSLLMVFVLAALFITGAGAFAVDLPY